MRLVKSSLALLAFFAVVWTAVLASWHLRARMPGVEDMAYYLIGLPLLLLAVYAVLRKLLGSVLNGGGGRRAAAAPAVAAAANATPAEPARDPELALAIAGTALHSAHGRSAADLLAASRAGARPSLDAELTDDAGYPLFSGRMADLDTDTLAAHFAGEQSAVAPERLRTMALLAPVLDDLRERVLALPAASAEPTGTVVKVSLLLDAAWTDDDLALLRRWLAGSRLADGRGVQWQLETVALPADDKSGVLAWIGREARALRHAAASRPPAGTDRDAAVAPRFWLIAAADSFVDQSITDTWAASGRLHGAATPQGLIAGEAAAGLLLALPATGIETAPGEATFPVLADILTRELVPADAKPSPDTLTALADDLLAVRAIDPSAVVGVTSDADHRRAPISEVGACLSQRMPHLAIDEACVPIGQACGHTGGTAQLAALVLAAELATEARGATLALAVTNSLQRSAALVVPASAPAPDA